MPPRRTFKGKASPTDPAAPAATDPEAAEATVPPPEPAATVDSPPPEPAPPPPPPASRPRPTSVERPGRGRAGVWTGAILIGLGLVFLLNNVGLLWWWRWDVFWPLVIIAFGVYLIVRRFR